MLQGQRVRPPQVDALQWRQALHAAGGEHNAQHLWPVLAVGFRDLVARKQAQVSCLCHRQSWECVPDLLMAQGSRKKMHVGCAGCGLAGAWRLAGQMWRESQLSANAWEACTCLPGPGMAGCCC